MNQPNGIKTWSEDDRPREKLLTKGARSLSDAELLAILLGSGSRNESAVDLSRRILQSIGNDLVKLGSMGVAELSKFKGMGDAKSVTVIAAMELARRRRATENITKSQPMTSKVAYELLLAQLDGQPHEEFWVMALNRKCELIKMGRISEGGLSATVVDLKKIFRFAIDCNAAGIIAGHNHPSGNIQPSAADNVLTRKMREAGKLLDCEVFDHIIVTAKGYYSYADEGTLMAV